MPRRNISAWKVCMSWQSGQRKWCRAARRAWPWRRGNISRGALRIAPGLGMTPGLRGWVVLGTMLLRSCGNAAYLDAVAVEMRAGAGGADEGPVAGASLHRLQQKDLQDGWRRQLSSAPCPVPPAAVRVPALTCTPQKTGRHSRVLFRTGSGRCGSISGDGSGQRRPAAGRHSTPGDSSAVLGVSAVHPQVTLAQQSTVAI